MSETDKLKVEMYDDVVKEKNKEYIELSCKFRETCNDIKNKDKEIERLNKALLDIKEYINNHQLVFELSNLKQIKEWFDELYSYVNKKVNKAIGSDK